MTVKQIEVDFSLLKELLATLRSALDFQGNPTVRDETVRQLVATLVSISHPPIYYEDDEGLKKQLGDLSMAYLRLRNIIGSEAFDTPTAPTPEQIWKITEAALKRRLGQ